MDQLLIEIATEYGGQIFIGSVDYDDPRNAGKCRELRVINLPALALFHNGEQLETVIGLPSKQSLNRRLEECLLRFNM
jgi:thioredoxin-like negative regulator of GroEL